LSYNPMEPAWRLELHTFRLRNGCATCRAALALSRWPGSNGLTRDYKTRAGPNLLHRHDSLSGQESNGVGANDRIRTGVSALAKRCANRLRYVRMRASGQIRTDSRRLTMPVLHLVSFEGMSTASGGRTRTFTGFESAPSASWGIAAWLREQVSNLHSRGQSSAACR
jgi:hypothetical protein